MRQSHPSGYAASRMSSSSGARNGTGAPCSTTCASSGSRLLGKSEGSRLRSAGPSVLGIPSPPAPAGPVRPLLPGSLAGTRACSTLKEKAGWSGDSGGGGGEAVAPRVVGEDGAAVPVVVVDVVVGMYSRSGMLRSG